ncbi:MAG: N-acetylneuraminate synthase family protein [Pseudomonadota bacterium]|nr:N-acetylneuraminate synthase family protein [Pseudomonadota bacterium]
MKKIINIEGKKIGYNHPVFTIGEIGSNHNRSKKTVLSLIDACSKAGFDAVKFQIYDAEEAFSKKETTKDVKLDKLYGIKPWWKVARDKILMPREWFGEMFDYVRKKKMIPLSAIHRLEDLEFLRKFGLSAIKIASIDLNYYQLHEKIINFKLPTLISTGMGSSDEISQTLNFYKRKKHDKVILLHCNSLYPPKNNQINLRNILYFQKRFKVLTGFSDHTVDNFNAFASIPLGSKVIEKHITLNKKFNGPDHPFAIEPHEMKDLIYGIRKIEDSLGFYERKLSKSEKLNRKMIRRSIVAKSFINKNKKIIETDIKYARPGTGIPTSEYKKVIGKIAKVDIEPETLIKFSMIKNK